MSALLALSDVAVMRALERCYSRGLSGDARNIAAEENLDRHRAYQRFPIGATRQSHALAGAWSWLPELTSRWLLPVEPADWELVLDRYARALLTTKAEHTLDDLEQAVRHLGAGHAA